MKNYLTIAIAIAALILSVRTYGQTNTINDIDDGIYDDPFIKKCWISVKTDRNMRSFVNIAKVLEAKGHIEGWDITSYRLYISGLKLSLAKRLKQLSSVELKHHELETCSPKCCYKLKNTLDKYQSQGNLMIYKIDMREGPNRYKLYGPDTIIMSIQYLIDCGYYCDDRTDVDKVKAIEFRGKLQLIEEMLNKLAGEILSDAIKLIACRIYYERITSIHVIWIQDNKVFFNKSIEKIIRRDKSAKDAKSVTFIQKKKYGEHSLYVKIASPDSSIIEFFSSRKVWVKK